MKKLFSLLAAVLFAGSMMAEGLPYFNAISANSASKTPIDNVSVATAAGGVASVRVTKCTTDNSYVIFTLDADVKTVYNNGDNSIALCFSTDKNIQMSLCRASNSNLKVVACKDGSTVTPIANPVVMTSSSNFFSFEAGKTYYIATTSTSGNSFSTVRAYFKTMAENTNVTVTGWWEQSIPVPVTGVTLSETAISIETGTSKSLTATVLPANATNKNVTWSSDNEKVTVVDGVITVAADATEGATATITVKTVDQEKTATCIVTVIAPTIKSDIVYANTKGASTEELPAKYSEGIGIESFPALADVEGFKFTGWTPASISATATGEQTITATWAPVVTKVIYSWEGHAEAAIEEGGTATGLPAGNEGAVNYAHNGYYTFQLGDKADYSGKYVSIALDEATKTGDVVKMTAYYYKDQNKTVGVKIADGSKAEILTSADLPNIYDGTTQPANLTYTIPANVETSTLLLTRSATATTAFVTKFEITRVVGLVSSEFANSITIDGAEAEASAFNIDGQTITLTASYTEAPAVALIATEKYTDGTQANKEIAVTFGAELVEGNFVGTATIGETTYTVKAAKDQTVYHTVRFFDGETEYEDLKQDVEAGQKATKPENDPKKDLYAFLGWREAGAEADFDFNTEINADVNLYARWEVVLSSSLDLEAGVLENGTDWEYKAAAQAAGIVLKNEKALDNLADKTAQNYPFLGLKFNTTNSYAAAMVPAGKYAIVKLGQVKDGAAIQYAGETTNVTATTNNGTVSYVFAPNEVNRTLKVIFKGANTNVLKAILIVDALPVDVRTAEIGSIAPAYDCTAANADVYRAEDLEVYTNAEGEFSFVAVKEEAALQSELKAGVPYVYVNGNNATFTAKAGESRVAANREAVNGVSPWQVGTDVPEGNYILNSGEFHLFAGGDGNSAHIGANRCYFKLSDMVRGEAGAPARILGMIKPTTNPNVTGVENTTAVKATKALVNGKLVIVRGAKAYDVNGKML